MTIAEGKHPNDALEVFKGIITTEFLTVQLMEASKLARQSTAVTVDASDLECGSL
jgi:hypothetical protein